MGIKKTLVDIDPWLRPHGEDILKRQRDIEQKTKQLLGTTPLQDFALGHLYFGVHRTKTGWVVREWAPHARQMFLVSDRSQWRDEPDYQFTKTSHGIWELQLSEQALDHGMNYKLHLHWPGGDGLRLPAYTTRAVQDPETKQFVAQVWAPPHPFVWTDAAFTPPTEPPLIYEVHVGMSSELPEVAQFSYVTEHILPRVKQAGYNTLQLMGIAEHPYYGSFGYHVSNYFAVSSRFGTPDEFKQLVDTAHALGLRVILDLVHSHAVKNEDEGLSRFDGTLTQYFHSGERGHHSRWDSRVFDYGKPEVVHFLLSNCRFWLDEYHVDGFRFDGVTSMLYTHHGLDKNFSSYGDYFDDHVDLDALTYVTLANQLIHTVKPTALTCAEEMSALPGLAGSPDIGGHGFDYRLSMGTPDRWITLLEQPPEQWHIGDLFHELTTHRPEEKTISYAESHDQAMVGDKTILMRLLGKDIYDHMHRTRVTDNVRRGLALHKLIRALTATTNSGGYLTFMGNEFGHPEWIDFPREGNDWSYHYARRQWSLVDNPDLLYHALNQFDHDMIRDVKHLTGELKDVFIHEDDRVLSFERNGYLCVFNISGSYQKQYSLPCHARQYNVVLDSSDAAYGGPYTDSRGTLRAERQHLHLDLAPFSVVILK